MGFKGFEAHPRVSACVDHKGGLLCRPVYMIVVLEFAESEELLPIILPLIHEESEELLQLLVNPFGLAVCLWVIGC